MTPRVALLGLHGYGRVHLDGLLRLAATGAVRVAGLADPRPPEPEALERVPGTLGDLAPRAHEATEFDAGSARAGTRRKRRSMAACRRTGSSRDPVCR